MERWAVIADDLTGALDTALQFRKAGKQTIVSTRPGVWPSRGTVVALSTETRHVPAADAAASVTAAFRTLKRGLSARIYKKTDSLLRGNIGAELRALCDVAGAGPLVFAPAYPTGGRTTIGGVHRLEGVPVAAASPGRDPLTPVRESHIPTLLRDSGLRAEGVSLDVVRGSRDGLVAELERAGRSGVDILAPDVENNDDLNNIASAVRASAVGRVSAGSAGLAEYLAGPNRASGKPSYLAQAAFVAAVVGTPSTHTKAQVERALATDSAQRIRIRRCEDIQAAIPETCRDQLTDRLLIFDTTIDGSAPRRDERRAQLRLVGELCSALVGAADQPGLILTGGDTARAALDALGVDAIEVLGEIEWGVPAGHALDGRRRVATIVTKGGSMGGPDALTTAFRRLCSKVSHAA